MTQVCNPNCFANCNADCSACSALIVSVEGNMSILLLMVYPSLLVAYICDKLRRSTLVQIIFATNFEPVRAGSQGVLRHSVCISLQYMERCGEVYILSACISSFIVVQRIQHLSDVRSEASLLDLHKHHSCVLATSYTRYSQSYIPYTYVHHRHSIYRPRTTYLLWLYLRLFYHQ